MKRLCVLMAAALVLVGCERDASTTREGETNMVMTVKWQRLVTDDGQTCERCGSTQEEFRKAVATLEESLRPLGMEVASVEEALTPEEFAADTIESNRVLIEGRSLEDWLGGETGESECESCCSAIGEDVKCRTVRVDGNTYEVIPAELIVRAGLVAASHMMESPAPGACCPDGSGSGETGQSCCPGSRGSGEPCCPGSGKSSASCCPAAGEDEGATS